jgi:hypothetical protein
MPVIIRIKRGTESQIIEAPLYIGELALATDTNKLFVQSSDDLIWVNPVFPNFLSFTPRPPNINDFQVPYAVNATASTTLALRTGRIYWIPFVVPRKVNITQIAIRVTTASAGTHYIGIYASNSYWQPTGSPLVNVSYDTGTTGLQTSIINVTLSVGVHWFAWVASSNATVQAIPSSACASLGLVNLGSSHTTYYYIVGLTLPDPAPSSGYVSGVGDLPAIGVAFIYV